VLGLLLVLATSPAQTQSEARTLAGPGQRLPESAATMSANWVVLEAIGTAAWRAEGERQWREFMPGEVLPADCEIETGADGEVTLVAGGDQLIVAPLGRLIVPEASPGQDRLLRHERGRILVHIEPRKGRNVQVDTPLLSLGIKGTMFEVEVGEDQDSVVVHDGEVEVTPRDQTDPVALGAGDGLRKSATPGSPATRFTSPDRDTPSLPVAEPAPHRSPADGGMIDPRATPNQPDTGGDTWNNGRAQRSSDRTDRPASSGSQAGRSFGWVDDWASSWAWVAIAGVALLLLTIPLLALVQNLREQRLGRPQAEGRRRRELIRG
jgi:FecR protein